MAAARGRRLTPLVSESDSTIGGGASRQADASAFYNKLQEGLNQNQPLATDVLVKLGAQRAEAILAALQEAGVDPARAVAAAPEKVESDVGKPVPLKLGLAAK